MTASPAAFDLYAELKSWQSGIGALLGFVALLVGALWNYHLNRKRDAWLRREEMLSVASALYSEILLLRKEVAGLAAGVAKRHMDEGLGRLGGRVAFDRYFFEMYRLPEPLLYPALAARIGLLPPEIARPIVRFHANYAEAKKWLPMLEEVPERGYSYGALWVLRPAMDAINEISPALREIEKSLRIETPAPDPPTGDAASVIDMEEAFWSEHK